MRRVFASQRVETAEGVAKLLREAGIEILVTNGRGYKTRRSGQFSYLDKPDEKTMPSVWVVHADDQPKARQILREAGLMETTRPVQGDSAAAAMGFRATVGDDALARQQRMAWRIRIVLFVLLVAGVAFVVMRARRMPHAPPAAAPVAAPAQDDGEIRVRITDPAAPASRAPGAPATSGTTPPEPAGPAR